jgi:hypothetical protein
VSDIKEHARKRHEEETRDLPKKFFQENNSFYLARNTINRWWFPHPGTRN